MAVQTQKKIKKIKASNESKQKQRGKELRKRENQNTNYERGRELIFIGGVRS